MELVLLFSNSFLVGFSGAMMPGPLLTVGIAETPRSGWRTGPIISIGHAIAEVVVVVLLSAGVVAIGKRHHYRCDRGGRRAGSVAHGRHDGL